MINRIEIFNMGKNEIGPFLEFRFVKNNDFYTNEEALKNFYDFCETKNRKLG